VVRIRITQMRNAASGNGAAGVGVSILQERIWVLTLLRAFWARKFEEEISIAIPRLKRGRSAPRQISNG